MIDSGYYNVSDFNKILFDNPGEFVLDDPVNKIFEYLIKNINITAFDGSNEVATVKKNGSINNSSDRGFKRPNSTQRRTSTIAKSGNLEWETARTPAFKVTKLEIKEGLDKQINDVRGLLNKMSSKNYDSHRDVIIESIKLVLCSEDASDEDKDRLVLSVLDISRSNKFYSGLYAELCKELAARFPEFSSKFSQVIDSYFITLEQINYVDHNLDYDGFCNYTKSNDLRKANAAFIVNLMKNGVLEKNRVIIVILKLIEFIEKYIDEDNRSNETDEITENFHLFVTQSKSELAQLDEWQNVILPFIQKASTMKSKDHVSLSSRAVFKYMDILDDFKKK